MTNQKTFSSWAIFLALAAMLLAACGAPEASPETSQPTATSAVDTAILTQAPLPTDMPVPEPSPSPIAMSTPARHALFLQIWMSINDRYVYSDHGGLDWEAVKGEYSEKVNNATSDEEFYDLMREMVDLLGDDHSSFMAPEVVALRDTIYENLEIPGGIGAYLSEIDGELVLVQVLPDGPGFEAGLRPGESIVAVDNVPRQQFSSVDEVILAIIGEAGTEVILTVRSVDGAERQVPVTRAAVDFEGALVQGKVIEGTRIGWVALSGFDSPRVPGMVRDTLGDLMGSDTLEGLVVDARVNSGGDVDTLLDTLALFVDGGSIGRRVGRKDAYDLLIPEGETLPELEGMPIAVLIGPRTTSAGESFAVGMQLHDRATILGMPSVGNTEYASGTWLSDGSMLWIAEWVYELPDGTLIEGRGVQPDVRVEMDWWLYGAQDDPQLEAAIELLQSQ